MSAGGVAPSLTLSLRPVWNDDGHLVCWEVWPTSTILPIKPTRPSSAPRPQAEVHAIGASASLLRTPQHSGGQP